MTPEFKCFYFLYWLSDHSLDILDLQKNLFLKVATSYESEIYDILTKYTTNNLNNLLDKRLRELRDPSLRQESTLNADISISVIEEDILCEMGDHFDKWSVQHRHIDDYFPFYSIDQVIDPCDAARIQELMVLCKS